MVRSPLLLLGLTSLVLAAAAPSCKTATVIRATFTSNFGCESGATLSHAVMFSLERTGNPPLFDGKEPVDATRCTPRSEREALIGDLVLRPPTDGYEGTYDLIAIAGTSGPDTAQACNLEGGRPKNATLGGQACVVARRRVRFVEATEVAQNVFLSKNCAGVVCGEGSSCNPLTSRCTGLKENSTSTSGGGEGSAEIDGSVPPDMDAGAISDAAPDTAIPEAGPVDASIATCNMPAPGRCNQAGSIVLNFADRGAPYIVAGGGRVAWVSGGGASFTDVTEYDPGVGLTTFASPAQTVPLRLGYMAVNGVTQLFAVFRPSNSGPHMLKKQSLAGWTDISPPNLTTKSIEGFASNGQGLGCLYETERPGNYVPLVLDPTGTKSEAPSSTATTTVGAMTDVVFGTANTTYFYVEGQTVHQVSTEGKVNSRPSILPALLAPARLLADLGADQYLVSTNGQVGKTSPTGFAGPFLEALVPDGVTDTATDSSYVYVLRRPTGKNTTSEVFAISRTTAAICKMPIPEDLDAIAVDASCLYGARRTLGAGVNPNYDLRVFRKASL